MRKIMSVKRNNKYLQIARYALVYSMLIFLLLGLVTVLIPNIFFARMTPVNFLDYVFLMFTSVLLGLYLSIHRHSRKQEDIKQTAAVCSGGVFGFLGFGCTLCNKLLMLLLGAVGVLTYIEPYRPLIGGLGVGLMGYATYKKGKKVFS